MTLSPWCTDIIFNIRVYKNSALHPDLFIMEIGYARAQLLCRSSLFVLCGGFFSPSNPLCLLQWLHLKSFNSIKCAALTKLALVMGELSAPKVIILSHLVDGEARALRSAVTRGVKLPSQTIAHTAVILEVRDSNPEQALLPKINSGAF